MVTSFQPFFAHYFWTNNSINNPNNQPKKKDHKNNPTAKFAKACPISPTHRKKIGPKRKAPKNTFQLITTTLWSLEGL